MFCDCDAETARVDESLPGFHPVALPLKAIGGQFNATCAGAVEHARPVGRFPEYVELCSRQQEPAHAAFVASKCPNHSVVVAILLQCFLHTDVQHWMRTGFNECAISMFVRPSDSLL